jgi:hypothetical protein
MEHEVHYYVDKTPPLVPILRKMSPVHTFLFLWTMFGEEHKLWSRSPCNFSQTPVTSSDLTPNIILRRMFLYTFKTMLSD